MGVIIIPACIQIQDNMVPVWLLHHDRSLAPIRRSIGDSLKNIRRGKLVNNDVGPDQMDLTADIMRLGRGCATPSFYDFKTPNGRISFAFLAGSGYSVNMTRKEALTTFSTIIDICNEDSQRKGINGRH